MSEIRDFDRVRPVNKHNFGSILQKAGVTDENNKVNWNSNLVKTGVTTAAGAVGSALSGGMSTGVGTVFNTIGDIGSMIPGPYGAIIGAAGKVLGGLTNSLFGSKLNYENINTVKNNISNLNAASNVDAANYDDLAAKQKNTFAGARFDKHYIGSDGVFSHKARNMYRSLAAQEERAEDRYRLGTAYNADQIGQNMINNSLRNYSALGGPLEYSLANRDLDIKAAKLNNLSSAFSPPTTTAYAGGGLMASAVMDAVNPMNVYKRAMKDLVDAVGLDNMKTVMGMVRKNRENKMAEMALAEGVREFGPTMYAKGGKIHIKKANRGKFTAAAKRAGMSVQEYARHILANKDKYTPTLVKRANFARNASKFKHADGGYLDGYNAFLDDVINSYGFGEGTKRTAGRHAEGGGLATNGANFTNGLTQINEGGSHEENANEGVLMGTDQNGVPNTVEEGETIYKDYVFSDRLTIPDKIARKYHLKNGITFAEASKQLSKESEERPNDPVSQRGLDAAMQDLIAAQEEIRQARDAGKQQALIDLLAQNGEPGAQGLNAAEEEQAEEIAAGPGSEEAAIEAEAANAQAGMGSEDQSQQLSGEDLSQLMQMAGNSGGYAYGGYVRKLGEGDTTEGTKDADSTTPEIIPLPTWQRQAPLYGLALQSLTDAFGLTNNPDYTEAETLRSMAYRTPHTVSYSPTATYLNLRPMDVNSTLNALRADAAAKDRMALDMAGANRGLAAATLLSNRYVTDNAIGKVYNDLLTYNNGIREKMAAHNQTVNQHNADQALAAASANASNYNAVAALNNEMLNAAMTQRVAERNAVDAAKAANWSNFLTSLGNYGTENLNQNALNFLIASGGYGPIDKKFWPLLNLLLGNNKPAAKKTAKASSSTEKRGGSKSTDSGNRGVYMTKEGLPNWNYVEYWNDILD